MSEPKLNVDKDKMKKKLFRLMESVAFLPENSYDSLNTDAVTGDVKNLTKLTSPAQKTAAKRINSQREFNEAFDVWFSSLGFNDPQKKSKIRIATTITHISEVMKKNGIQY